MTDHISTGPTGEQVREAIEQGNFGVFCWTEGDWLTQACLDAVRDINDMYHDTRVRLGLVEEDTQ